jgi:glycine/D-amino acid oxidase-like deaminating enzyme
MNDLHVVIVGAGLQGCCIALEMALRGAKVTILEQDSLTFNRASLRNEGKIHLGIIYAQDETFKTAQYQLEGALQFRKLLSRWIGLKSHSLSLSNPFQYVVAQDSLLTPSQLEQHFFKVEQAMNSLFEKDEAIDYLGSRCSKIYEKLSDNDLSRLYPRGDIEAVFQTSELAIDTQELAILIRGAIAASSNITTRVNTKVIAIDKISNGYKVFFEYDSAVDCISTDQVVNASWENRIGLDKTLGIEPIEGWVHRLKFRLSAKTPESLYKSPSVTKVLGGYGDIVIRPDSDAYLSWYPRGLKGWSHDLFPPSEWGKPCAGVVDAKLAKEISEDIREGLSWYPGIELFNDVTVDAGAIFAYGRSDIDDLSSRLHDRSFIGVTSLEGFHSVDPGKLTTAPLFAIVACDAIEHYQKTRQ